MKRNVTTLNQDLTNDFELPLIDIRGSETCGGCRSGESRAVEQVSSRACSGQQGEKRAKSEKV